VRVHFVKAPTRRKPQIGEQRTIRGVLCQRVFRMVHDARGRVLGYDCTGGRQRYDWKPVAELAVKS
jgi:hypothetical protein